MRVGALLGSTELDAFSIDLVAGYRELVGPVERDIPFPGWWTARISHPRPPPLDTALAAAGRCYGRILGSLPSADIGATWNPERKAWEG